MSRGQKLLAIAIVGFVFGIISGFSISLTVMKILMRNIDQDSMSQGIAGEILFFFIMLPVTSIMGVVGGILLPGLLHKRIS